MSIRFRCGLFFVFVVASASAMSAERTWKMATTPHYVFLSQVNDRESASWMRNFDQFILSTADVLKMDTRALPPLTVVIFDRDKDYTTYKPMRPDGSTANAAGQFVRWPTWSMIGMAHDGDNAQLRRTIYHEATHWLMSADQARHPAWFAEGIAEMFSTFERRGEKVNWAKPIGPHLSLLYAIGDMPLADFLTQRNAIFNRDMHTDRFYAQAWAFTHFLMLSKEPGRRQLLLDFLKTYRTQSGEATVQQVFGSSLKELERQFHIYINQRSFGYMAVEVKPAPPPPTLQPAPQALVEGSLGFLAFGAQRYDLARQHATKAIALDAEAPGGHALLAYLALRAEKFDDAVTHAEAALQRGSKDSDLYMLIGDSYLHGQNSGKSNATQARVNMYESAINLNPRRLAHYERLTEALMLLEKPREEDARFLDVGLKVFPGEDWLRVGKAAVAYRLGRKEDATNTLDAVLKPESTLDESQRYNAANLRRGWLLEEMNSEIRAATENKEFGKARAAISRYRERLGGDAEMATYLDEMDSRLQLNELMGKYEQAVRSNKRSEARALANEVLALPDLPAELREYFQQLIRATK